MNNKIQLIVERVKESSNGLNFKVSSDPAVRAQVKKLLQKEGLSVDEVTIGGVDCGLFVSHAQARQEKRAKKTITSPFTLENTATILTFPTSSAISLVSREGEDLIVVYKSGSKEYRYVNVPSSVWSKILQVHKDNESIGRFIAKQVKPYYSDVSAIRY